MSWNFPKGGVGQQWTSRFVEWHYQKLKTYNAKSLESIRGKAVNPFTNAAWFDLLREILDTDNDGNPIAMESIWAADEAGFQPITSTTERVIGAAGKRIQHKQRGGVRENTTVIVTIGADGSALPPAVIFKGKSYQMNWKQNNPANAS